MIRERGYDDIMRDTITTPTKPWQTFPNLIIDCVPLEKKKSDYSTHQKTYGRQQYRR